MYVPSYWHLVGRLYVVLETSYTYNSLSECFDRHNSSQFTTMYRIARPHSHHTHNNINASSLRQLAVLSFVYVSAQNHVEALLWGDYYQCLCGMLTSHIDQCHRPTSINLLLFYSAPFETTACRGDTMKSRSLTTPIDGEMVVSFSLTASTINHQQGGSSSKENGSVILNNFEI